MSEIAAQNPDDINVDNLLKTGVFTKEIFGETLEGIGSIMKEEASEQEDSQAVEEGDGEVIDIDNEEELAAKGLKRIQIEGEDEEYLMDLHGNIYDLQGNFIGTTNENEGDEEEEA